MEFDSVIRGDVDDREAYGTGFDGPVSDDFDDGIDAADETERNADQERRQAINWETDDNPFYTRFKGLQGSLQKEVETRKQLESQLNAMQAVMLQQQLADLPESERAYRMQEFAEREALRRERQTLAQLREDLEQGSKIAYVQLVSQQYGIPKDKLMQFNDPDAMEAYARDLFEERKRTRKQTRKQQRSGDADRFEGGGTSSPRPKKKFDTIEEAAAYFATLPAPVRR